jgi:hypothetical protein
MTSARRIRGFGLSVVGLFLILCYYYSSPLVFRHQDDDGGKVKISPVPLTDAPGKAVVEPSPTSFLNTPTSSIRSSNSVSATKTAEIPSASSHTYLDSSDVLLIFKTGASTIWSRMPLHLTTTLANGRVSNSVVYSDLSEQLANNLASIDTLWNVSNLLQIYDPPAYSSYLELKSPQHANTYREHAGLPGDEPAPPEQPGGNPLGWLLDKYKFLPMLTHAQRNWPGLKWYIYIEDDTFLFLDNILKWLATFSPDGEPSWYGAWSGEGNQTFAQGGSGLVFSRSLMSSVFGGNNIPDLENYGNYTANACCGDMILGKVLRDQGFPVNRGEYGSVSFRPEPPWKTGFEGESWCYPVFTFHHLHQRDLVQLAQFERAHSESALSDVSFQTKQICQSKPPLIIYSALSYFVTFTMLSSLLS